MATGTHVCGGFWKCKTDSFGEVFVMIGGKSGPFLSLLLFDGHHAPEP